MISGIYKIINLVNDNLYIGQASDLHIRLMAHKRELNGNYHYNTHLQRAWNKYGENNFRFEIIEECPLSMLNEREMYWISFYGKDELRNLYNKTAGGEGLKDCSEETKLKLRNAHLGKPLTEEHRKKISKSNKGKKHPPLTEEQKIKLRESNKNRKASDKQKESARKLMNDRWETEEWLIKVRSGIKANIDHYGHSQTEETKKKIGDFNRGKIWIHNESGCIKIYPKDFENYKKLGYTKGMK